MTAPAEPARVIKPNSPLNAMSKNNKKNRPASSKKASAQKNNHGADAKSGGENRPAACPADDSAAMPNASIQPGAPNPKNSPLALKSLLGTLDTDLYGRLFKPALMSFGLRRDDEALRQIVESIVTSIAMRDAYDGYRKLDDICQRYLYYLESYLEAKKRTWELVEINGLCDYWRSQVLMTFIRDSQMIFNLLLPDTPAEHQVPKEIAQDKLLQGVGTVLNPAIAPDGCVARDKAACRDLYDFVHGMSFPWLGYEPDKIFNIRHALCDENIRVHYEFALADAAQTKVFAQNITSCLEECMFIDLIFAQHKKLYDEIISALDETQRMPKELRAQMMQKIRFDHAYQTAFESILSGQPLTKPLHRSSRLKPEDLNAFGLLASMVRHAAAENKGVYLFHYLG